MLWWKPRQNLQVKILGFRLKNHEKNSQGELIQYQASTGEEGESLHFSFIITHCWETLDDKLLLNCFGFGKDTNEEKGKAHFILDN